MHNTLIGLLKLARIVILVNLCTVVWGCGNGGSAISPTKGTSAVGNGAGGDPTATIPDDSKTQIPQADGVGSGGGGDVILCFRNKVLVDMESLDLWVTKQRGYKLTYKRKSLGQNQLSTQDTDYSEQTSDILDRLALIDPIFASSVRDVALEFTLDQISDRNIFQPVESIPLNGDSGEIHLEKTADCDELKQERLFWQLDHSAEAQVKYLFNQTLWNKAPQAVKAAVVRHEAIWRRERQIFNPATSVRTQRYNAVLSSDEFKSYNFENYKRLLAELSYVNPQGGLGTNWLTDGVMFSINYNGIISWAPDLIVHSVGKTAVSANLAYVQKFKVENQEVPFIGPIRLDKNNEVMEGCIGGEVDTDLSLRVEDRTHRLKAGDAIRFERENSQLHVASVVRAAEKCKLMTMTDLKRYALDL